MSLRLPSLRRAAGALALLLATAGFGAARQAQEPRVLVFSKTAGFRHGSIEAGVAALRALGQQNGFAVDATEDAGAFSERNIRRYRAVVFLNTTGDVLNDAQQSVLERYIQAGGGWVGVHAATDTEYDWPWYGRLAGAYFVSHPNNPNVRKGTFRVLDKSHSSTEGLPDRWEREDEFYNFKSIQPGLRVLVDIDETSYQGGANGDRHPMSWYREIDGGRAWYTAMGHTDQTYSEPLFLQHLLGGIRWAMGGGSLDYARARPEENRFTKVVLAENLREPVELAVLPDERVLFVERRGQINLWSPATQQTRQIGAIPVSLVYGNGNQAEDGLLGLAADPGFAQNGWVYMYYSPAGPAAKNVLARFTMRGDSIVDLASPTVMLEIPVQRAECCHTGGSIAFDRQGNLYLSTGDNTNPFATGYAPIDERPLRSPWDAQKSSGNTNDLRGKILRIRPQPDGSYTIPEGNLFPPGTIYTRPEIYTMGHRNPYRISVDQRTGFLYWGDVGPDASVDSTDRGPAGHDEVGQARRAGNFGWPFFVGDNKAYWDVDHATMTAKGRFDPARPVNDSPNNTGLTVLPPAQKAFIWYPAGPSAEFPLVGTGGRTAMAGPVFYRDDFRDAARPWPAYYDGKLLAYEWMRGWIIAVAMDAGGDLRSLERVMPSHKFSNPIDLQFGPSGDLFMLEYGTGWFSPNPDARLVRIQYNAGNRAPVVAAAVDRPAGATPLRVALSAAGTADPDADSLSYEWTIAGPGGRVVRRLTGESPTFTFARPGAYTATLAVTDPQGARATAEVAIAAGNEPPRVDIDIVGGNRTFYFPGAPIQYAARVTDREDGSLASGRIRPRDVIVTAEYLKDGPATAGPAGAQPAGHRAGGTGAASVPAYAAGRKLIEAGTCLACHQIDRKSIGPSYTQVAQKYKGDTAATDRLVRKIQQGGKGVWGEVMMPPHPQVTDEQAQAMVAYIRSLADERATPSLPTRGAYTPPAAEPNQPPRGAVVLRVAYADRGANGAESATAEKEVVLRAPTVVVASGDSAEGVQRMKVAEVPVEMTIASRAGAFVRLSRIDLTGITAVSFVGMAPPQLGGVGGTVEIRRDSPTGPVLGESEAIRPVAAMGPPSPVRATLQPTSGVHDLYLVFRNPEAGGKPLFVLLTATFEGGAR